MLLNTLQCPTTKNYVAQVVPRLGNLELNNGCWEQQVVIIQYWMSLEARNQPSHCFLRIEIIFLSLYREKNWYIFLQVQSGLSSFYITLKVSEFSPKNHQDTGLEDCGWGKPITRLTKAFTFQRVGLAHCGHTAVCGDRGAKERGWVRKCLHISTLSFKERESWLFKYLPSVKPSRSNHRTSLLFFVFLDNLYFTNY